MAEKKECGLRWILVVECLVFLLMAVGFIVVLEKARDGMREQIEAVSGQILQGRANAIGEIIASYQQMLASLAKQNTLWEVSDADLEQKAHDQIGRIAYDIVSVFVVWPDGRATVKPGQYVNIADRAYIQEALSGRQESVISPPLVSRNTHQPAVIMAHAIRRPNGEIRCLLAMEMSTARINGYISQITLGGGQLGYTWIADQSGLIFSSEKKDVAMRVNIRRADEDFHYNGLSALAEAMFRGDQAQGLFRDPDGVSYVAFTRKIPDTSQWWLGISIVKSLLFQPLNHITLVMGIVMAIAFSASLAVAFYINKMRASHKRLKQARSEALASAEAKSRFLSSMSHEIRTPMNAILGFADLMRTDNLDDEQRRYLQDIHAMSEVLLQIINDILDISKIEAGKMELTPIHYRLPALYENVRALSQGIVQRKNLTFHSHISPELPEVLYGDDLRLQQIMLNLINNAIKYTSHGGIWFWLSREVGPRGDSLTISVRDTGVGIEKGNLDRIFGNFERIENEETHRIGGSGLGLPITRQLVEMMGGHMSVASRPGEGSTFTAHLPLVEGDPEKIVARRKDFRRVLADKGVKVLVVDDSEINLAVASGYLAKHGIVADTAKSGQEAITMVERQHYDLVFMDQMMPGMDGVETTKRLRALSDRRFRDLPIIALTADAVAGQRELFLAAGMNDFIAKPIDPERLNAALSAWLPADKQSLGGIDSALAATDDQSLILDRAAGIARLQGDEVLYRRIAAGFLRDHGQDAAQVVAFLRQEKGEQARRVAHTLKSAAAIIGAARLKQAAAVLEEALAAGQTVTTDDDLVLAMNAELALALAELRRELATDEKSGERPRTAASLDRDKALAALDALEPLLAAGNARALELLEENEAVLAPLGEAGQTLITRINDLDFPAAHAEIAAVRRLVAGG
ncbi:MAG: response regulator [Desulfobulbaceae bacterium]|jgi:signal transduction histidine kinase/DNA-binding response OmpR family regulator|nr:response regulator [Desulfobulbaceae bacterium]